MKPVKIIVNIAMLVFVALSLIRWSGDPTFHVVIGSLLTVLFITHFSINIKPFVAMTKKLGKLNVKMKLQYAVDVILLVLWSVVVLTGITATITYLNTDFTTQGTGRLHGMLGRISCGFILIHTLQHIKQIRLYFKKKNIA